MTCYVSISYIKLRHIRLKIIGGYILYNKARIMTCCVQLRIIYMTVYMCNLHDSLWLMKIVYFTQVVKYTWGRLLYKRLLLNVYLFGCAYYDCGGLTWPGFYMCVSWMIRVRKLVLQQVNFQEFHSLYTLYNVYVCLCLYFGVCDMATQMSTAGDPLSRMDFLGISQTSVGLPYF